VFWEIFGTACCSVLVTLVVISINQAKHEGRRRNVILKRGICPECGSPLMKKDAQHKGKGIGFTNEPR